MSTTARWSLIIGIGVAATLAFSFFAALTADDRKTLAFIVFAIVLAPACIGSRGPFFHRRTTRPPPTPRTPSKQNGVARPASARSPT